MLVEESPSTALVVTSINPPNQALRSLAAGATEHGWKFVLAGDSKSPPDFQLDGCEFLALAAQRESGFGLARIAPEKSYTRKNIAYLHALAAGARVIVETDDDNHPTPTFWIGRKRNVGCRVAQAEGWVNAYRYFTGNFIYPRGLPMIQARGSIPAVGTMVEMDCPIQQGLADQDPDVDAVYRMLFPLPFDFDPDARPVLLAPGAWCPFNSQNTTFFADSFPLMFLPAHCSFRMTDIWRSFVAQRVLHERGQGILFHGPTVWQERNMHDLDRDFAEELPGYLHNSAMREALVAVRLSDTRSTRVMMERCYETLIRNGWVGQAEEKLLEAWFCDLEACGCGL
jgi:hypothetical protein